MLPAGKRILVAGVGNVFHGDDAFGVEVVRALEERTLPCDVQLTDFGIRSYDLAFAMLDGYEAVVLLDAAARGKPPGSVFLLDAEIDDVPALGPTNGHSMNPQAALSLVNAMGGYDGRLLVIGCEPATLEPGGMSLSAPVEAAVNEAADLVERLIDWLLSDERTVEQGNGT